VELYKYHKNVKSTNFTTFKVTQKQKYQITEKAMNTEMLAADYHRRHNNNWHSTRIISLVHRYQSNSTSPLFSYKH